NVKKNITVEQIIWKGGAYLKGDLEAYETELGTATTGVGVTTCGTGEKNEVCLIASDCTEATGGTVNSEATCWEGAVCCGFVDLG
ncbi:MAG: hypothetical protein NTZ83_03375, partial [Candidatus Pacearchaeota archaeon]|nr:hypothetical protein [Candidatus Pacearchaeota archaeon]